MKNDKEMFSNIIGYNDIKMALKRIIDILNNQDKYKQLGSKIPHGLLLYGNPGTGKTSISKEFLNNCHRKTFIVRKNKGNGEFINYLNNIFEDAKKNEPSIILLDDLDKFSETDNYNDNNAEYVVVQSLIDEIQDKDIFVIATVNNEKLLPKSLLRSGRFDIQLQIEEPTDKDSFAIINYYLNNKKIAEDVNIQNISYILNGSSCADLEKVCNQAGIYAGYKNESVIHMEDLLRSSLEFVYNTNIEDINKEDRYIINIAYHEAGHALIKELLEPNSVQFITTIKAESSTKGMIKYHNNDNYWDDINFMKNRIKALLAGKAATEIVFNNCDTGCNSDLHKAFDIARRMVDNYCMYGFDAWYYDSCETSEKVKQNKDDKTNELITKYYDEVKKLLIKYRPVLDALAKKLKEKKILFQAEIYNIIQEEKRIMQEKDIITEYINNSKLLYNPIVICGKEDKIQEYLNNIKDYIKTNSNKLLLDITNDNIISSIDKMNINQIDILIIKNLEKLENNIEGQQQLFNIFNNFYNSDKQIIISTTKIINELQHFEKRLITRLYWGKVITI